MSEDTTRELRARTTAARLVLEASVTEADYQALRNHMIGYLLRTMRVPRSDATDIVDAAVEKFLAAAQEPDRVRPRTALAYLRRIARNEAIDRNRRRPARPAVDLHDDVAEPIDRIARLVDERATSQQIHRLMNEAARSKDLTAVKVMNEYLKLAESLGESPPTRMVALRAGVSHTTVGNVLARLREMLDND